MISSDQQSSPAHLATKTTLWHWMGFGCIVALSIGYRFSHLDSNSLWADELWGVMACSEGSWSAMLANLIYSDNHPPGYQTILYFFMQWFGNSDFIIRLPSAIAGTLTVIACFFITQHLFTIRAALIASLLIAGSFQAIYYSQEARAYALLALFCLLNTYFFILLFVLQKNSNLNVFLFSITGTACAYLHYMGVIFFCTQALILPCILYKHKNLKTLLVSACYGFGIAFLLYFRWFDVMHHHMTSIQNYWAEPPSPSSFIKTFLVLLGPSGPILALYAGSIFTGFIVVFKNKTINHPEKTILVIVVSLVVLPITIVFIKSLLSQSIYTYRHFAFIIPLLSILAGYFICHFLALIYQPTRQKYSFIACLISIAFLQFYANTQTYNRTIYDKVLRQDFKQASQIISTDKRFIQKLTQQKSIIIISHHFFLHYLNQDIPQLKKSSVFLLG